MEKHCISTIRTIRVGLVIFMLVFGISRGFSQQEVANSKSGDTLITRSVNNVPFRKFVKQISKQFNYSYDVRAIPHGNRLCCYVREMKLRDMIQIWTKWCSCKIELKEGKIIATKTEEENSWINDAAIVSKTENSLIVISR